MRKHLAGSLIALMSMLAFPLHAAEQPDFDPMDLSGVWVPGGPSQMSEERPPMTEWGDAKWRTTRAARRNPLANGYYPNQAEWNDGILWCDPGGYPRLLWYTGGGRGNLRLVHAEGQIIQFFERDHVWRDFWMDGRSLPENPEPRWFGYSVGRWEGDTFVVESNGFDDRAWIDQNGSIFSPEMRMTERYRRLSKQQLELVITIDDPKTYTAPWVSETKILEYLPTSDRVQPGLWGMKADGTEYGGEIREDLCIYSEQESFFQSIDPDGVGGRLLLNNEDAPATP